MTHQDSKIAKQPMGPNCPYCAKASVLHESSAIVYRGRDYGPIWLCVNYPECDAYVGCHPGTHKALGRLARKELRQAKMQAHSVFDPLWKRKAQIAGISKGKARRKAYRWLAEQMGIPEDDCHIGMFSEEECLQVVDICQPYRRRR